MRLSIITSSRSLKDPSSNDMNREARWKVKNPATRLCEVTKAYDLRASPSLRAPHVTRRLQDFWNSSSICALPLLCRDLREATAGEQAKALVPIAWRRQIYDACIMFVHEDGTRTHFYSLIKISASIPSHLKMVSSICIGMKSRLWCKNCLDK